MITSADFEKDFGNDLLFLGLATSNVLAGWNPEWAFPSFS